MARFDIYRAAKRNSRVAYLLDVQDDGLSSILKTRVVVPLVRVTDSLPAARRLHPEFRIGGKSYAAIMPELAGVPVEALGAKVASAAERHFEIVDALDFVFQGY
ncbi:MAG: CcdB family protein [Rhodospirillaceae bacterium]|nr:CcdB family protein [Rhodospirillaceae bacterium]